MLEVRNVITAENDTNLARRSTANLTSVCVAKIAPQDVATDTNVEFLFPPGEGGSGLDDYSFMSAFVTSGSTITQPKRCSADLG